MTPKQIVLELCKREGKKKQVDIAQMTETVGHLADMVFFDCSREVLAALYRLGDERCNKLTAQRKPKRKKARRK